MRTAQEAFAREPLHCGAQVRLASCYLARGKPGDLALAEVLPGVELILEGHNHKCMQTTLKSATVKYFSKCNWLLPLSSVLSGYHVMVDLSRQAAVRVALHGSIATAYSGLASSTQWLDVCLVPSL